MKQTMNSKDLCTEINEIIVVSQSLLTAISSVRKLFEQLFAEASYLFACSQKDQNDAGGCVSPIYLSIYLPTDLSIYLEDAFHLSVSSSSIKSFSFLFLVKIEQHEKIIKLIMIVNQSILI